MKKMLITYIIAIFIIGCSNNRNTITISKVIDNIDKYDNKVITVKGFLKIHEMGYKSLFIAPNHDVLLDLSLHTKQLPEGVQYIPNKFYCVVVTGVFKQYTDELLALNSISDYGIILVKKINMCE
ncbi:MAG: hypothetical protein DWP95_13255 [Proteobacteria bacterium]|nr:MAG: hypothetical protein DWP95_13255 [Pseudomonadota bacterium]